MASIPVGAAVCSAASFPLGPGLACRGDVMQLSGLRVRCAMTHDVWPSPKDYGTQSPWWKARRLAIAPITPTPPSPPRPLPSCACRGAPGGRHHLRCLARPAPGAGRVAACRGGAHRCQLLLLVACRVRNPPSCCSSPSLYVDHTPSRNYPRNFAIHWRHCRDGI